MLAPATQLFGKNSRAMILIYCLRSSVFRKRAITFDLFTRSIIPIGHYIAQCNDVIVSLRRSSLPVELQIASPLETQRLAMTLAYFPALLKISGNTLAASSTCSVEHENAKRRYPSPDAPNAEPGAEPTPTVSIR